MGIVIAIIVLVLVAIILNKSGSPTGVTVSLLGMVFNLLIPTTSAAVVGFVGSAILTPFIGIPLAIITFCYLISKT